MATTAELVRGLSDGSDARLVRQKMSERRRMLGELIQSISGPAQEAKAVALSSAVAESDRTLEAMLECTKVSIL
jgi:hypothetical protein